MTNEEDKDIAGGIVYQINRERDGHFMGDCAGDKCPDWITRRVDIITKALATVRAEEREAAFKEAADYIRRQWLAAYPVEVFYERILTIEWDKYNARRHELIKAERSRVLSESEVLELFELQWLARIKHGLSSGPRIAQKQPLPDRFLCINPEEQPTVINFLRGYGTDADRELARLHLNLCLRCQDLANAAPMEQSDESTCVGCIASRNGVGRCRVHEPTTTEGAR